MDHHSKKPDGDDDLKRYLDRDLNKGGRKYKIVSDEFVGRHMIAAKDIKPGEVIFKEAPLTFGPAENSDPVCLGCYKAIEDADKSFRCPDCEFPMCGIECCQVEEHRAFECAEFGRSGHKFDGDYGVVSPLRALMLKKRDPKRWRLVWNHMSHDVARKKSKFWRGKTEKAISALKKATTLLETDESVRDAEILLGILLVNDFEMSVRRRVKSDDANVHEEEEVSIRALFGLASMPNHSCVANATHDFSDRESGFVMTMRAVTKIAKGADIHHAYTEPLDPILVRRSLLQVGKFFRCDCPRCNDPAELGTMTSAVKCADCADGYIVPDKDAIEDIEADWKCLECGKSVTCQRIQRLYRELKAEADKLDPTKATIEQLEAFVAKCEDHVHPNHVLAIDKKYHLAKMYGRMKGFEADSMSEEQFKRKLSLCRIVLAVLDKILPGRTRKRGMMMYEMHLPLVMLANRALQKGPNAPGVDPARIKDDLKSGLANLRMGLEILKDEPEGSFERCIVDGSKESLQQLEQWVKTVTSSI